MAATTRQFNYGDNWWKDLWNPRKQKSHALRLKLNKFSYYYGKITSISLCFFMKEQLLRKLLVHWKSKHSLKVSLGCNGDVVPIDDIMKMWSSYNQRTEYGHPLLRTIVDYSTIHLLATRDSIRSASEKFVDIGSKYHKMYRLSNSPFIAYRPRTEVYD